MAAKNSVTVVTVTRNRPTLLQRALQSVRSQDYNGSLRHLVIVDDCAVTVDLLNDPRYAGWAHLRVVNKRRLPSDRNGPARLGRVRNHALDFVDTQWVSFLDDDNTFAPEHISSLVQTAQETSCLAVHSQRRMFHRDGRPYLEEKFPWVRDAAAARQLYEDGVRRGVFKRGSNVVVDQVDLEHRRGGARIVDMSAWLLDVDLLRTVRFREEYNYRDWLYLATEDNKLLRDLISRNVAIASTQIPTLNYYLGGYSNDFADHTHEWLERPGDGDTPDLIPKITKMSVCPPKRARN